MIEEDKNYLENMSPVFKKHKNEPKIKEMAYRKILYFAEKGESIPSELLPFLNEMFKSSIKSLGSTYKPSVTKGNWAFKIDCVDLLICICGYKPVDALEAIWIKDQANHDHYAKDSLRKKRDKFHKEEVLSLFVHNCKEFESAHSKNKNNIEKVILGSSSTVDEIVQVMYFG